VQRMGMILGLKPEKVAEYKHLHAAVWPEILAMISACNIRNYSIFLKEPENLLFAYYEYHGADYAADMAKMAADPKTRNGGRIACRASSRWTRARRANGGR
jgi:L-rhamnose mutarotase